MTYHAATIEPATGEPFELRNVSRAELNAHRFDDGTVIFGWYYLDSDMFDFEDFKVVDGKLVAAY